MYQYKFRIPPYFTLLVRSLTILEGIALASDPDYKVLGAAYPWVARRLFTGDSPELQRTLRKLLYRTDGLFRFDRFEALLQQAVRSPPRPGRADGATSLGDTMLQYLSLFELLRFFGPCDNK
jgi:aarF domain-containing kinase